MKIGLVQPTTGIDPQIEAAALAGAIAALAADGAEMVFTPEMSGCLDRDRARAAGTIVAEADDMVLAAVREAAAAAGVWVHLGSLALQSNDGRFVNRGFLIDATGAIRARYAKIHLFDVDLPNGESWRESSAYAPGDTAVVAATPWGPLGLSICYDLRFPALYRALAEAGATMLSIPAAFTRQTGRAHWHVLQRARAIETGCFVIAAAQTGNHADGRETFGHSLIVAPWGEVLLDMGEAPGSAICEIDLAAVAEARDRVPALRHARPFTVSNA
ncbi:nitrilase [alpha proteobacterium AAP81b]|nr:nitrilase [alpha proteobacterium AAP81b]